MGVEVSNTVKKNSPFFFFQLYEKPNNTNYFVFFHFNIFFQYIGHSETFQN